MATQMKIIKHILYKGSMYPCRELYFIDKDRLLGKLVSRPILVASTDLQNDLDIMNNPDDQRVDSYIFCYLPNEELEKPAREIRLPFGEKWSFELEELTTHPL